jgi:hypothetical protein
MCASLLLVLWTSLNLLARRIMSHASSSCKRLLCLSARVPGVAAGSVAGGCKLRSSRSDEVRQ